MTDAKQESCAQHLKVSPLLEDDCQALWLWRNDASTRAMSLNTDVVSFDEHLVWFNSVFTDPTQYLYMVTLADKEPQQDIQKVGFLRFDLSYSVNEKGKRAALISINLNPQFRGKGLSVKLLRQGINTFVKALATQQHTFEAPSCIKAIIKKENIASIKCFEGAGFSKSSALPHDLPSNYVYLYML